MTSHSSLLKLFSIVAMRSLILTAAIIASAVCSPQTMARVRFGSSTIDEVVAAMTLDEKVNLVVGTLRDYVYIPDPAPGMPKRQQGPYDDGRVTAYSDGRVAGAAGETCAIERLGIPSIVMADGPAGVRIDATRPNDSATYYCTAFPTASLLAATWDTDLVRRVGQAIGDEARHYGVDLLLAPAMNIMRSPLCGRNFEYFSEDPVLTGEMAAAYTRGVQSAGVGATLKHFAVNNQETMRNGIDAVVSDRALRDVYLRGFEIATQKASPMAVMSSYNKINGTLAAENKYLLTDILRGEWGFDGFVLTDWWAEGSGDRQTAAGNDMLMPGTWRQYDEITAAIADGSLAEADLDRNVANILRAIARTPAGRGLTYDSQPDLEGHARLAREVAAQGFVLLENRNHALPVAQGARLALFGNGSYDTFVGGTGSGNVNRPYKVNIDRGLADAGMSIDARLSDLYLSHLERVKADSPSDDDWNITVVPEPGLDSATVARAAAENDMAVLTIGRMAGEGKDRTLTEGDWFLTPTELANLDLVTRCFHAVGKSVTVLLNMGSIVDMSGWHELPDAIVHIWLPGQEGGNAVADVLGGAVNPSGRLPMTIARRYEDYSSAGEFPHSTNRATTYYTDDIFVGYRYFDEKGIEPLYPFGYGLSYTTFEYPGVAGMKDFRKSEKPAQRTVAVTNTGDRAGAVAVPVFTIHKPSDDADAVMPRRELKSFVKTPTLAPGETTQIPLP